MDIAQLRFFVVAGKSKNFTDAARKAFTSRQNLTRSIHRLEDELGAQLFIQDGNTVKLTERGKQAFEQAVRIVGETDCLSQTFHQTTGAAPTRIALAEHVTHLFGFLNAESFKEHPIAICELQMRRCCELVSCGQVDLALVACMNRDFNDCRSELISTEPFFFLCSKNSSLAEQDSIGIRDLAGHDVVLWPDSQLIYTRFLEAYEQLALPNSTVREVSSETLMKHELRLHDAVAIVNESAGRHLSSDYVSLPCSNHRMRWCLYALMPDHPGTDEKVKPILARVRELGCVPSSHV